MKQTIIAVVNQKGGVGKTTTTVNLAAQLASPKHPVLVADLDPQGNATSGLGADKHVIPTMYEVLCQQTKPTDAIRQTNTPGLYVLPANANLAGAEVELVQAERREYRSREVLSKTPYDYVLIDCPPSLGLLTVNALTAADSVLMPVQAEYYALEGLGQLLETIQRIKQATNPALDLAGVLLTMYDKRTSLSESVRSELENYFHDKLLKTAIPRNVRLAEAPSYGRTIFEHDRWSTGARAYKRLAKEMMRHGQD